MDDFTSDLVTMKYAGASLVQTYTGLAYAGPAFVPKAKQELAECLARDGFSSVQDAVGADHRRQNIRTQ